MLKMGKFGRYRFAVYSLPVKDMKSGMAAVYHCHSFFENALWELLLRGMKKFICVDGIVH